MCQLLVAALWPNVQNFWPTYSAISVVVHLRCSGGTCNTCNIGVQILYAHYIFLQDSLYRDQVRLSQHGKVKVVLLRAPEPEPIRDR